MSGRRAFEAVIADMDGVLTRTADLHERAWKQLFDHYLRQRLGREFQPFTSEDYRAHVDGKPRYDGVADFLASRGLQLPRGEPTDGPDQETVCGLGNRKNARFQELLDEAGVHVFDDATIALDRWRRGGLKLAAISASRNCRRILEAAGLLSRFDVVVDGQTAEELSLDGKQDIMLQAAQRLAVDPESAVVLEDATAGVRAARQGGFGLVVGVSRNNHEESLREAGAHTVVRQLHHTHFPRHIPSALDRLRELEAWQNGRRLVLFLDFDGTLAPIVDDPAAARLPNETRSVLRILAERCPVTIVSGRDRADVQSKVDIDGLHYAGNHGFDIMGPDEQKILPEAEESLDDIRRTERELEERLGEIPGMVIEPKRFSVAVHFRGVADASHVERIVEVVEDLAARTGLRQRHGKKVLELEPPVDWDKGRALRWLLQAMDLQHSESFIIYIGDDTTDEDAFAALEGDGAGIVVADGVCASLADYRLDDPEAVQVFLQALASRL